MICAKCADRRSPSEKCDRQACAASWFIAPTISARMREGSARIDGRTIFGCLILHRYSYVRRVADEVSIIRPDWDCDTQPKAYRTPIGARALRAGREPGYEGSPGDRL